MIRASVRVIILLSCAYAVGDDVKIQEKSKQYIGPGQYVFLSQEG